MKISYVTLDTNDRAKAEIFKKYTKTHFERRRELGKSNIK
jgi:hypothetical protein